MEVGIGIGIEVSELVQVSETESGSPSLGSIPFNLPHRPVVAAALVDSLETPTRMLGAQRSYPKHLAGYYEFPGGKVEAGEAPDQALHRELGEELGVQVRLGDMVTPTGIVRIAPKLAAPEPAWPILEERIMWVWLAEVQAGQAQAGTSHTQLTWIDLARASELRWLPTNLPIAKALQQVGRMWEPRSQ